jgi:hypothetical protein
LIDNPQSLYIYTLKPDSLEINARPGDFNYALAPESHFGFLDQNAAALLRNTDLGGDNLKPAYFNQSVVEAKLTSVTIEAIDRVNGTIALRPGDKTEGVITALEFVGISFASNIILDPTHEDFLTNKVLLTLQGIGYPAVAGNPPEALRALASLPTRTQRSADTEAAQFLWNAGIVHTQTVTRPTKDIRRALEGHLKALHSGLDDSQWAAWNEALTHRLTLVWGPPGTGKSHTLRTIATGVMLHAIQQHKPLRLLVAANTNTAIDNVLLKLGRELHQVALSEPVKLYRVQSKWRKEDERFEANNPNITSITLDTYRPTDAEPLLAELKDPKGINVIGCLPQQLRNRGLKTRSTQS